MSIEENRNCSCNCNCECEKENTVDCDLRREMIQEIRCCEFAITELAICIFFYWHLLHAFPISFDSLMKFISSIDWQGT